MGTISDEIAQSPSGARFFRADLHIHSLGGSHDVKDESMTPEAIVQTALSEQLSLIAITDHNEITNVAETVRIGHGKGVAVISGVELSTPEGHLLVYFSEVGALAEFYGKLTFADRGTPDSRCQTSMLDCLNRIDQLRGFAVLAHVDADAGLERKLSRNPPHKGDIICHPALVGIELRSADSEISYSDLDPDANRKGIGSARIKRLSLGERQYLARVLFSDSHSLSALGKNANGQRRLTRIKMVSPSFEALRVAMQDADARIRLEEAIPTSVAYVMGVKLEGGFLDGQVVHFSRNLNCIIGGRGAGKSTAFEAVRTLAPGKSSSRLIDSEIWPEVLHLVWVDKAGQQHTLRRRINESVENLDDSLMGPIEFATESYGQNETAQTSVRAQQDPLALLEYLDQFVDCAALQAEDEQLRSQLLENQTEIEKAQTQVARIPDVKKLLAAVQQQLKALAAANAQEVVALERKVAEERALRQGIEKQVLGIGPHLKKSSVVALLSALDGAVGELKVGAAEYQQIRSLKKHFEQVAAASESQLAVEAAKFASDVQMQIDRWKSREQQVLAQIDEKRKELLAKGIRLDLAYIKKLATDEATYQESLKNLATWEAHLKEIQKLRSELLGKRQRVRSLIFTARTAYAVKANMALRGALADLAVGVKFSESALSPEAEEIIQQAMGWRTSQVPRAALVVEQVTVPALLDCIRRSNPSPLMAVETKDGVRPFDRADALALLQILGQTSTIFRLQRCALYDLPRITITRQVVDAQGKTTTRSRDFAKLSLGQQQSVLLALMLSSDSEAPLIIDQPEDNLDGEFIFHSLVPVLRAAKERRQVIVVTHNANIAVLGDAEQIIALKSSSDKSVIVSRGSIDDPKTKAMACSILEGAEEAFRRRARMYGVI